jgi:hypothetical protein
MSSVNNTNNKLSCNYIKIGNEKLENGNLYNNKRILLFIILVIPLSYNLLLYVPSLFATFS